jgi:hypothetical protein
VMAAATEGRIAPTDTTQLLRACKMSFEAALVFQRTRQWPRLKTTAGGAAHAAVPPRGLGRHGTIS